MNSEVVHHTQVHKPAAERPKRGTVKPQPLAAATIPGAELKIETYCAVYGVSKATAFRRIQRGELKVKRYGQRCTRIVVEG